MPTFAPGYQSRIYNAGFDASPYFNSADLQDQVAKLETTAFGNTAKQYTPGLAEGALKAAGFFAGSATDVNTVLRAELGSSAGEALTYFPALDTLGAAAYLATGRTTNLSTKSAVGGMVQTDAEWVAHGGWAYGVSLAAQAAITTTGNGTGVDGGAATSTGWRATLHVFAVSGTATPTITAKLQDSADNVTFADVTGGGFTAVTAVGGQVLASAATTTTLRRYVRLAYTVAGTTPSFTLAAAVARSR